VTLFGRFRVDVQKWAATIAFIVVAVANVVTFGVIQTNRLEVEKLNDKFCLAIEVDRRGIRESVRVILVESTDSSAKVKLQAILDTYPEVEC